MTGDSPIYPVFRFRNGRLVSFGVALCIAVCGSLSHASQLGRPIIEKFPLRSIGAEGTCLSAVQDSTGILYVGCDSVMRYDGERWTSIRAGRASNICGLAFDQVGRLWVAASHEIGYFIATPNGPGDFVSLVDRLPPGAHDLSVVWHVLPIGSTTYFVGSREVLVWDGIRFETFPIETERRLSGFVVDNAAMVFSSTSGAFEFRTGSRPRQIVSQQITNGWLPLWSERGTSDWLGIGNKGLVRFSKNSRQVISAKLQALLEPAVVSAAVRLDHFAFAAGTLNSGIVIFNQEGKIIRHLTVADGLPANTIYSLFLDRDHNLWVGTEKHLSRISSILGASLVDSSNASINEPVGTILLRKDAIYIAKNSGLFLVTPGEHGSGANLKPVQSFQQSIYTAACIDDDLLTAELGYVYRVDDHQFVQVYPRSNDVNHIFPARRLATRAYFATSNRLILVERQSNGQYSDIQQLSIADTARSLVETSSGELFAGTQTSGVFYANLRQPDRGFEKLGEASGIPADTTRTFVFAVKERVLVATERGAFLREPGDARFKRLVDFGALRPDAITRSHESGPAWLALTRTLGDAESRTIFCRFTGTHDTVKPEYFEISGANTVGAIRALALQAHNSEPVLWIGGKDGLLRVETNHLEPAQAPRTPLLRVSAEHDRDVLPKNAAGAYSFGRSPITFTFGQTEFGRHELLAYQTRLLGVDSSWSAPTKTAIKEFPFLQDRNYRFEVRSIALSGLVSEPASFEFTILPPWYRTHWAYLGYFVAGGCLWFATDRLRTQAMKRRTQWLEEQVRQRTAELARANAAKTDFVARINHDIRNPINGVMGLTLALEQTPLTTEQRRMAGTIKQCAKFLASLVEEVLDFAEIESGSLKLKAESFSLHETVAASVATIEPLANAAGCTVAAQVSAAIPPRVTGDSSRVQQILVNFLSNAVKFGNGSPVDVTATMLHEMAGRIFVRIGVRDHGPGLSESEKQQLFVKFTRGRIAAEKQIKGTGLGLAVCRLLAEKLGGRVGVVSTLGEGAEFFLEIPLEHDATPVETIPPPIATNARVLIVEDEDYNAVALIAMLQKLGFRVDRCIDGLSALDHLARHRYEIIFLDWELPGLNGIEVARRFRDTEPPDQRALIIATTAYASADKQRACRDAGMDEFVSKPLSLERIVSAIRGHNAMQSPATSILVREEATTAAPDAIDLSLFSYLADDATGVAAKVTEFVQTCEQELSDLEKLLSERSGEELRKYAHRFLNQCRFIGATHMSELTIALEQCADDPAGTAARKAYDELCAEFGKFKTRLQASLTAKAV